MTDLQKNNLTNVNDDSPDHFVVENGIEFAGRHVIIDFWDADHLDDLKMIETALIDAAKNANATILGSDFHKFEIGGGISGVVVLAESHISIHTWPERKYAALDVFMCGDSQPNLAVEKLKELLQPSKIMLTEQKRGVVS